MKRNRPTSQPTLAAFGVKKFVMHNGEKVKIDLPLRAVEIAKNYPCDFCGKSFKKPSGLAAHTKCVHGTQNYGSSTSTKQVEIPKMDENSKLPGSSQYDVVKVDRVDVVKEECKEVLLGIMGKIEGNIAKSAAAKKQAGKKRHSYSAVFKADAIFECMEGECTQMEVAAKYGIDQAMLSRWISKKTDIFQDASDKSRKLLKKGRKSTKYTQLYQKLMEKFRQARGQGQQVTFPWLWSKARVIQNSLNPNVSIKNHVIVRFLRKYDIRLRAKQRSKNRSKASMIPELKKWHATFRERCIRSNSDSLDYDDKWGAF